MLLNEMKPSPLARLTYLLHNLQIGSVDLEPEKSWVATQQLSVG